VLYTVVRMEGGAIYWWGVLPVTQRKKLLGKLINQYSRSRKKLLVKLINQYSRSWSYVVQV
jgi:hypothetical protein